MFLPVVPTTPAPVDVASFATFGCGAADTAAPLVDGATGVVGTFTLGADGVFTGVAAVFTGAVDVATGAADRAGGVETAPAEGGGADGTDGAAGVFAGAVGGTEGEETAGADVTAGGADGVDGAETAGAAGTASAAVAETAGAAGAPRSRPSATPSLAAKVQTLAKRTSTNRSFRAAADTFKSADRLFVNGKTAYLHEKFAICEETLSPLGIPAPSSVSTTA